jgi:hypothetical protein
MSEARGDMLEPGNEATQFRGGFAGAVDLGGVPPVFCAGAEGALGGGYSAEALRSRFSTVPQIEQGRVAA